MVCLLRMLAPYLRNIGLTPCIFPPMPPLAHCSRLFALCLLLSCQWLEAAGFVAFHFEVAPDGTAPLAREITAQVRHADGRVLALPAFHNGGNGYCVRAMAYQKGDYSLLGVSELREGRIVELKATLKGAATLHVAEPLTLEMVRVDPAQPRRFVSGRSTPFYPLGMNLA